ncbi:DMR6-LIKE OXYGENASE 2-like protein [Drosera capensis]
MRRVCREWFEGTEVEEKLRYKCDDGKAAAERYGTKMLVKEGEGEEEEGEVLDWRDYFDHHTWPMERRRPECPREYRNKVHGLRASWMLLEKYTRTSVRYYPLCPQPELTLGLQAHSDFGAITLLIQDDTRGLQVFKDGEWITVEPVSDAIVVILADQTEVTFWLS